MRLLLHSDYSELKILLVYPLVKAKEHLLQRSSHGNRYFYCNNNETACFGTQRGFRKGIPYLFNWKCNTTLRNQHQNNRFLISRHSDTHFMSKYNCKEANEYSLLDKSTLATDFGTRQEYISLRNLEYSSMNISDDLQPLGLRENFDPELFESIYTLKSEEEHHPQLRLCNTAYTERLSIQFCHIVIHFRDFDMFEHTTAYRKVHNVSRTSPTGFTAEIISRIITVLIDIGILAISAHIMFAD